MTQIDPFGKLKVKINVNDPNVIEAYEEIVDAPPEDTGLQRRRPSRLRRGLLWGLPPVSLFWFIDLIHDIFRWIFLGDP